LWHKGFALWKKFGVEKWGNMGFCVGLFPSFEEAFIIAELCPNL